LFVVFLSFSLSLWSVSAMQAKLARHISSTVIDGIAKLAVVLIPVFTLAYKKRQVIGRSVRKIGIRRPLEHFLCLSSPRKHTWARFCSSGLESYTTTNITTFWMDSTCT
jgi:hypothetical protein